MTGKRIIALLLTVFTVLFCFAACGEAAKDENSKAEASEDSAEVTTTDESIDQSTDDSSEDSGDGVAEEDDVPVYENGRYYVIDIKDPSVYAELGDYEGVSVKFTVVADEYVAEVRNAALENAKEPVDANRPAALGDLLVIDFEGYIKESGEKFEGGTATDYTLTPLGSAGFVPGFEAALVGHSAGESFDIFVTFPEEYHAEEMQGVETRFAITIKAVKEYVYPQITDELAKKFGYESADALNKAIYDTAVKKAEAANLNAAWDAAVKNCDVVKYPEKLYDQHVNDFVEYWMAYYRETAAIQGVELEELLGKTEKEIEAEVIEKGKQDANGYLKEEIIMFAIAKEIGADKISDKEFNERIEYYASMKGCTVEELKEDFNDKELRTNVMWDKVKEHILSKAVSLATHVTINVQDYGAIKLELDPTYAPITVANFVKLAKEGFYNGLTFHRIWEGFMIQGGDPDHNGAGGSDQTIKGEFSSNGVENPLKHTRGVISMARSNDPDSASSQFFIMQEAAPHLDGNYAAFGKVTEGMEVVDAIAKAAEPIDGNGTIPYEKQPVITSITIDEV